MEKLANDVAIRVMEKIAISLDKIKQVANAAVDSAIKSGKGVTYSRSGSKSVGGRVKSIRDTLDNKLQENYAKNDGRFKSDNSDWRNSSFRKTYNTIEEI